MAHSRAGAYVQICLFLKLKHNREYVTKLGNKARQGLLSSKSSSVSIKRRVKGLAFRAILYGKMNNSKCLIRRKCSVWGYSLVIGQLPIMCKVLDPSPALQRTKNVQRHYFCLMILFSLIYELMSG